MALQWEVVENSSGPGPDMTYRAKVPGGWLVFAIQLRTYFGLTFYPDPQHIWEP